MVYDNYGVFKERASRQNANKTINSRNHSLQRIAASPWQQPCNKCSPCGTPTSAHLQQLGHTQEALRDLQRSLRVRARRRRRWLKQASPTTGMLPTWDGIMAAGGAALCLCRAASLSWWIVEMRAARSARSATRVGTCCERAAARACTCSQKCMGAHLTF